jgi:sugar phosphate isomerase/epimerase
MQELGVPIVNAVCLEPDHARAIAELASFADLAAARGLKATLEMMPGLPLGSLAQAAAAVAETGRKNLGLLLDSMHIFRSGATVEDITALNPETIFYVQLCDVPLVSKYASYGEEARDNRLPPGEGELPLAEFIAALPPDLMLGLEVPMLAAAQSGLDARERLTPAVAATRALIS